MTRAIGTAARMRASAALMASATSVAVSWPSTAILAATSSSSGPRCRVRMWITRVTTSPSTTAAAIFSTSSVPAASPSSRDLVSAASTIAMMISRTPIHRVPMPSQTPSPVSRAMPTPARARTRPTSAPRSSSRTTGSSGALARLMNWPHDSVPRISFDSLIAVRNEKLSAMIAKTRTPTGQYQCSIACGCLIFS